MTFEREVGGFRYAQTHYGDDLRRVALRELGSAERWPELVAINGLVPPYLTDDSGQVADGVLLTGATILVPVPQGDAAITTDPSQVFLADVKVYNGEMQFDSGDLSVVSGEQNFLQSLKHRLATRKREMLFHPDYGNQTHLLLGAKNGPLRAQLATFYLRSALLEDDRVNDVKSISTSVSGDVIRLDAVVEAISGKQIQFNMEI